MPGDATPWDPNDWEQHIQRALKLRYAQPVGSYQHIADEIKGDCGIEGYAVDGTAYQCYACQIWNFVLPFWNDKELLKHARKKEAEVRNRRPKHTKTDFRIAVITGEEFLVE